MIIDSVKKFTHSSKTISDGYFLGTHFRFHRLLIDGFIIHHIYATHTHFISIVKKQYMQLFSNPYFLFFISLNVVSF